MVQSPPGTVIEQPADRGQPVAHDPVGCRLMSQRKQIAKRRTNGVPFGGAKGGVRVDTRGMSLAELERVTRRYTSEIGFLIGPDKDIPAPDVNTNERVMAWMMDTFSVNQGRTSTGVVTGKPISLGGSLGRHDATGRGVFVVGQAAAQKLGVAIPGARVCVQGFGNVGSIAARSFAQAGAKVIAIQDVSGTIRNDRGLDVDKLLDLQDAGRPIVEYAEAERIADDEFWGIESEFLVPAALEQQITERNAARIRTRILLEGANGPTTPEADDILNQNGVYVVPDVLANAGGVTVSYFEWVQDFSSYFWSEEEINRRLDKIMGEAYAAISETAEREGVTLRTATFIVACKRVLAARQLRGLYP
jgi:glutamate dehydrogenase (NAD(P)+)